MGIRGEIYSTKVMLPNRTYFFNVKENRMGDLYLNIVESKNRDNGGFDRQSVILFADDMQEFMKGFDESLRVLEKSVREKRRTSVPADARRGVQKTRQDDKKREGSHPAAYPKNISGDVRRGLKSGIQKNRRDDRSRRTDRESNHKPKGKKRVVIKK